MQLGQIWPRFGVPINRRFDCNNIYNITRINTSRNQERYSETIVLCDLIFYSYLKETCQAYNLFNGQC